MRTTSHLQVRGNTGSWLSGIMATITLITWAFAMIAVPPCGPACQENCIGYPYLDTLNLFPHDYIWIYLAIIQLLVFILFISFIHLEAGEERKTFTLPGLMTGALGSGILIMTYYVQAVVVPVSLMKEEYDGLALLTMYNEHGIFIASEEIAYLLMAVSMFLFSWIFGKSGRKEVFLKWLFRAPVLSGILAFIIISLIYGADRSYRFEIFILSVVWLALITGGFTMISLNKTSSSNK